MSEQNLNDAIRDGLKSLKKLIKNGARCDEYTLNLAIEHDKKVDKKLIKMLIKNGARCNEHTLNLAIEHGVEYETLIMLLQNGASYDEHTLSLAFEHGMDYEDIKSLELLIKMCDDTSDDY